MEKRKIFSMYSAEKKVIFLSISFCVVGFGMIYLWSLKIDSNTLNILRIVSVIILGFVELIIILGVYGMSWAWTFQRWEGFFKGKNKIKKTAKTNPNKPSPK